MKHNYGKLMAFLIAGIAILASNLSYANLQMPGDPPPPSILTYPPQNAWVFLAILFSVTIIASAALLALAFSIIRRARIIRRSEQGVAGYPPQGVGSADP